MNQSEMVHSTTDPLLLQAMDHISLQMDKINDEFSTMMDSEEEQEDVVHWGTKIQVTLVMLFDKIPQIMNDIEATSQGFMWGKMGGGEVGTMKLD